MKKVFFAWLFLLLAVSSVSAFEREAPTLPKISEPLAVLDSATGWMKMPSGEWVSRENRIPSYLPHDKQWRLDYEFDGLGVDNFIRLELREMEYKGQTYYLFLKHYRAGGYRYPRIEKGWYTIHDLNVYIIDKDAYPSPIKLEDRKAILVEIPVKANFTMEFIGNEYVHDIATKLAEGLKKNEEEKEAHLVFNMIRIGDAARFILVGRHKYYSEVLKRPMTIYTGVSTYDDLPIDYDLVFTEEVFRNFYYELDYDTFEAFWNGWRQN